MKTIIAIVFFVVLAISCKTKPLTDDSHQQANAKVIKGDTVTISNEETEYEVIIIDPGFTSWLYSNALPRGFYSLEYLENKNQWYVQEWNRRVMQPQRYDPKLYEMTIDYDSNTRYGYEVNYLIYNYMVYFQNKYKQQLHGFVPAR